MITIMHTTQYWEYFTALLHVSGIVRKNYPNQTDVQVLYSKLPIHTCTIGLKHLHNYIIEQSKARSHHKYYSHHTLLTFCWYLSQIKGWLLCIKLLTKTWRLCWIFWFVQWHVQDGSLDCVLLFWFYNSMCVLNINLITRAQIQTRNCFWWTQCILLG